MTGPTTYPSLPIAVANADDPARFYLYRPDELLVASRSEPLLTDRLEGIAEVLEVIPELDVVRFQLRSDIGMDVPAFVDELLAEDDSLQVGPNHVFWISEEEEEEEAEEGGGQTGEDQTGTLGWPTRVPGPGLIGRVIDTLPIAIPMTDPALSSIRVSLIDTQIFYHPALESLGFKLFASGSVSGDPLRAQPGNHAISVAGVLLLDAPGLQLTVLPVADYAGLADELEVGRAIAGAMGTTDLLCVPLGGTSHRDRVPVGLSSIPMIDPTVVIAAAGNHRSERPFWPAAIQEIVAVGAVGEDGRVVPWSGRGGWVDLYEKGLAVPAPGPDTRWIHASGTSIAAAAATARLARAMAEHSLSPREAVARVTKEVPTPAKPEIPTPRRDADPAVSSDADPTGPHDASESDSPVRPTAPEATQAQPQPTPALPEDATPTADHAGSQAAQRAGYASDTVPGDVEDRLDMAQEVEAISWVVAATDVDPPLSVGLFGDWGTGKSYFMRLMERCVTQIAATARQEHEAGRDFPACSYVRQITFNAWHYVDANLWASLVTHIFDELARPEAPEAGREAANLLGLLQTTQVLRQEAEAKKAAAEEERRRRTDELERVQCRRIARVNDPQRGQVDRKDLLLDEDIRDRAASLAQETSAADRQHAQQEAAADLPADLADVVNDPRLLRRIIDLVPDKETRSRLLAHVDDDAVRAGLSDLAADRNKVKELALLADDPQFRDKVVALVKDEQRREEVADLATQITEIYTNVIALGQVAADVRTTWGKLGYSWRALWDLKPWTRMGFVIPAMILVAGVGLSTFFITTRGWTLQGILTVLVSVGACLRVAVALIQGPVSRVKKAVEMAKDAIDDRARRQIASLEAQEAQLQREIEEARRLEFEAERELEDIRRGRRLYQYIQERASSTDYQQYLGIIALIRKDFERLADLMDEGRRAREAKDREPPAGLPQIDRVILYIDDLDRCPAKRVVEVLEAVHLLLALKLFVVVVGVDSRWLVRSLQRHYQAQLSPDEAIGPQRPDDWVYWDTTPQNYLEKIFQIVFSIRSMGRTGYECLLDTLFPDTGPVSVDAQEATPVSASAGIQPELADKKTDVADLANGARAHLSVPLAVPDETQLTSTVPMAAAASAAEARTPALVSHAGAATGGDQRVPEPGSGSLALAQTVEPEGGEDARAEHAVPGLHPERITTPPREALHITSHELNFMKMLVRFVPTPRSAKRLANTYRLMRVLVTEDEATSFRPGREGAGDYKTVLTLLAILIGFPNQAALMFRQLLEASDTNWPAFCARLAAQYVERGPELPDHSEPEVWERLLQYLNKLTEDAKLPTELNPYQYWCPRVARFSFQTGRLQAIIRTENNPQRYR